MKFPAMHHSQKYIYTLYIYTMYTLCMYIYVVIDNGIQIPNSTPLSKVKKTPPIICPIY